jgi:glycosyltransferase involved in cell wall biosynthesis
LFFNFTYGRADSFIVLGSEFKSKLRSWGVNKPVQLLTTVVNESLMENFSMDHKINRIKNSETTKILFLSRLEKEKGIFETIDAARLLAEQNHNIIFSIAGNGSVIDQVEARIADLGLNNVLMLGYVKGKEKIRAFTENDIYCFPTYYGEGMPTSVLEAMAFGMPVITRPIGGIKDFFKNPRMGYLCESVEPCEIAKAVTTMISDKKMICDMGFNNYRYAKKHFMASKVAKKLFNIYVNTYNDYRTI